jgi:signal transduction histidine kinase
MRKPQVEHHRRPWRVVLTALGFVLFTAPVVAQTPQAADRPWRIVLLHNADFFLPASTVMDQALRESLVALSPRQIDLYGEVLDVLRYPTSTEKELVELLRKKHSTHRVDVVMARAQGGLEFARKHAADLWPGAQIVFYNNVGDQFAAGSNPFPEKNITGVLIDLDPEGTLDLIRHVHPGLRKLYVVGGTAPYDLSWKKRVQALLARRGDGFDVTWLDDLPIASLLEQVSRLPADAVVLYTSIMRDAAGEERPNPQTAGLVAQAANVPVYGFLDTYMGRGVVGGDLPDFAAEGREAAKLALRVLRGETASSIPIQPAPPSRCVVDARALARWAIDESRLPPGCEVRFRSPSIWRDYRPYVIAVVLAVILQMALIAGLLVQRARLRQARADDGRSRVEVERALAFERLLTEVSGELRPGPTGVPAEVIVQALRRIGQFLGADRGILFGHDESKGFEQTYRWDAGASDAATRDDVELLPTLLDRVARGEIVALDNVEMLEGAPQDISALRTQDVKSLLALPLTVDETLVGILSFTSTHAERAWPQMVVSRIRLIGEVFANVLTRRRYATKVKEAQSETAQYRERLAHLVRVHTVGEMSAAIAHEVNQPLVAIENYAHAARRRLADDSAMQHAKVGELLDKIGKQAARAGDVLKRLRSIVKKHDSEVAEFDLATLVVETANLVEMESRLKDIQVEVAVEPGLPRALADEVQVQQVVLNLARNGIEAMEATASANRLLRIEVARSSANELIVRVADRGIGLSADGSAHIFEPFYSTKVTGLGVGLAICRSIVEGHGGRLRHSPQSGGGTIFEFTVPIAVSRVEA